MKKKVIALIMIIPLIFLITIFSVGKVASILADIPVSGIKITTQSDEGFIYLDMADYNADPDNYIYMQAQVEPANAKNQKYTFKIEEYEEGEEMADIEIDAETGLLTLNGTGKAKVTAVSADKGYTDSVVVSVVSSKVVSVAPKISTITGEEVRVQETGDNEYAVTLEAGEYQFASIIKPGNLASTSVSWQSDDANVVNVNAVTGRASTRLSGEAIVTLDCEDVVEGFEPAKLKVTVPYVGGASGMTIEGKSDNELMFEKGTNIVSFLLELENPIPGLGETVFLGITGNYFLSDAYEPLDNEGKRYKVTLTLANGHPENITLKLGIAGNSAKSTLVLAFSEFKFNVYNSYHLTIEDDIYQRKSAKVQYVAVGEPSDDNVVYGWSCSDAGLGINVKNGGISAEITANETGDYVLSVTAYEKIINEITGEVERGDEIYTIEKNIHVVRGVLSIDFVSKMGTSDGEGLLTLGDTILDDSGYKPHYYPEIKLKVQYDDKTIGGYNVEDLAFSGSNNSIVAPFATNEAFKVMINGDGVATITASWSNGKNMGVDIKTNIKIRGVKGGVIIGAETNDPIKDYRHLKRAGAEGKKIVLLKNVMLGWDNMTVEELEAESSTMLTEYDWTYYTNIGNERPSLRYLIEFKNDVYGNGYVVNADNFTMAKNSVGNPLLFKGPLDYVAIMTASVKAQDNIVYLVREKGITINNIDLKGCSDASLRADDNSGMDLTKLNTAGTTLELSGDTQLLNSRVSNGRTVVRIFGGEVLPGEKTKVDSFDEINLEEHRLIARIESCILTNAREFILKIGSNLAVYPDIPEEVINYAPKSFYNENNVEYTRYNNNNANDKYFYDNYVITDVTLKNSVLATSGLFTIGMETHFSGAMLAGYITDFWDGCAGTSFASVLRMEGDVKMYDWKDLDLVDSSTLIETSDGAKNVYNLRIDGMLRKIVAVKDEYKNIISEIDGKSYVHGGIAFYGGGYNYSCVDMSKLNAPTAKDKLVRYDVNISALKLEVDLENTKITKEEDEIFKQQGEILPSAAGPADFSFYMFDSTSNFNYQKQQTELGSGTAYMLPIAPVEGDSQ